MPFCNKCGTQLPDGAKFCSKCGNSMAHVEESVEAKAEPVVEAAPAPETVAEPAPAPVQEPVEAKPAQVFTEHVEEPYKPVPPVKSNSGSGLMGLFDKYFWLLFITTGLLSYLLLELASIYINAMSPGFAIFLGVMVIIFGICFAAIGTIKKLLGIKNGSNNAMRDTICLAIGIIIFVVTLIGAIGIFVIASYLP